MKDFSNLYKSGNNKFTFKTLFNTVNYYNTHQAQRNHCIAHIIPVLTCNHSVDTFIQQRHGRGTVREEHTVRHREKE